MSKKVIVTGGCGYIGSHTIVDLIENDFEVICIDNNSNSSPEVLKGIEKITGTSVEFHPIDLCNWEDTSAVFSKHTDALGIIHFAAFKSVGESVDMPLAYYQNNLGSLLNVLQGMKVHGIKNLIFSSSCSVYGDSDELPVTETTQRQEAQSPYARTKQMGEDIINDFLVPNDQFNAVLLRYFNPAGAHASAVIGEAPINKAQSLVPIITETAIGKRKGMSVHGSDYPTRDGSCIRDYIHVMDLANAHTKCLEYLVENRQDSNCETFNVGIGEGATVLEAINAFEKTTGVKLNYSLGPRRPGDVVAIYSNYKKAAQKLGWKPTRTIEDIMRSAWEWEKVRTSTTVQ